MMNIGEARLRRLGDEMVLRHKEEGWWTHWQKDVGDGAAKQETKEKIKEAISEDMQLVGATEKDAEDRVRWNLFT